MAKYEHINASLKPFIEDIENLYKADWTKGVTTEIICDMQVEYPCMPPVEKMRNYNLPIKNQKFRPVKVPHDLKKWDKYSKERYIDAMWHKRKNGEWWLIKGKPIYLNRYAWTFYDFWHTELGGLPEFRMEGVEFFACAQTVIRNSDCFGLVDIKPRRIGDTEKTLFLIWEICSRVRGSKAGMQNVTEPDAAKNFARLVNGNKQMPFFFKPVTPFADTPKSELIFDYPSSFSSEKKIKKGEDSEEDIVPPIGAFIDYQPTVMGKYDGGRTTVYHMDEPGKIKAFNINSQWKKVKPTMTLNNNKNIIGKAFFTTTVEDFAIGETSTLENTKTLWDQSDQNSVGATGRTISGLHRIFRSARKSAEVDEWGFHKEEEAEKQILEERALLEKVSDWDGLSEQKRKFPLDIDDVFAPSHNECVLFPALLSGRKKYLEQDKDERNGIYIQSRIAKPGNLIWVNGEFGGNVKWVFDPKGKWQISQHPNEPNYKVRGRNGQVAPGNEEMFSFGSDPIDAIIEGKKATRDGTMIKSNGAGAVFRKYDELVDGHLEVDEFGEIIDTELMMTEQYVCDYQARPDDPDEFCEDMLKTAIYYGVPMFFEKNKPSVQVYFVRHGFDNYLQERPTETKSNPRTLKNKEKGASATNPLIRLYTDALKWQVYNRIGTFWHRRIIACHSLYNVHNRSQRDLTVACGFAKLGDMKQAKSVLAAAKDDWSTFIFKRYKHNQRYL